MDQLKKTLIQRTRLRLAETWLSRIQVLSIWLDQISAQEIIDDDANELIIDHSSVESSAVDEGRSKRLCTTNLSTDGDTFHKSSGTHVSLSALRIGQARVKRECFRILSACDETRVLVNLRFLDVPSHTIKTLEDLLSELLQAQTACTTIRASITQYALSRAKALRKSQVVTTTDFTGNAAKETAIAVQEIDDEARFLLFQHFAQLQRRSSVSPLFEAGSGTASSVSCPPSPKLLDTLIVDAPNTPITPFTNRDSGSATENTSPLELYCQEEKEFCVLAGTKSRETPSPLTLSQEHEQLSPKVLHCVPSEESQEESSPLLVESMVLSRETALSPEKGAESSANRGRPAACLFVASLSSSRTDEQLCASVTNHFRKWGNLLNVKVLKDWMQRPYSFVQFENFDDAKRALREAHNTVIDGRHIRVEKARVNRTLYISRIGHPLEEHDVRSLLEPYGEIEDIVIPSSSNNAFRNNAGKCCFARFAFRDDAIQAFSSLRRNGNWIVEWAQNLDQNNSQAPVIPVDKTSIFVGQLNPSLVTRESLLNRFKKYGEIIECSLVNKPNSNRTAFAFLQFNSIASASAAVENENNSNFLDRVIRVQFRELHDKIDLSAYDMRSMPSINSQAQFGCKFPLSVPFIPRLRSKSNDFSSLVNRGPVYGQDSPNVQGYYPGMAGHSLPMDAFVAAYRAALAATSPINQPSVITPQNGYSGNIQVPYPTAPVGLANHVNPNSTSPGYNNQHLLVNIHQNPNIVPAPFYYYGGINVSYQNMPSNSSLNQDNLVSSQDRSKGNNVSPPFLSHWGALVPTFVHGPTTPSMQPSVSLPGHSFAQHQDSLNRVYHFPEGIVNNAMHPVWDPSFGCYRFDNQCSPEVPAFSVQVPALQDNPGSGFPIYGEPFGHSADQSACPSYSLNQSTVNGGIAA
ncbi:hypothetical protein PORY_000878 [Pneumocystis oryctolagi]|uniref:Uncharacterized protein n=1 Tax=Pneumocystis oryctolagi TaxID=42067 RepID=A0ACB7CEF4_9ASCO|nr:hypothetical protein PORY_000878 [Pneumocystis oryctolagi]